jgi:hypothetical protein
MSSWPFAGSWSNKMAKNLSLKDKLGKLSSKKEQATEKKPPEIPIPSVPGKEDKKKPSPPDGKKDVLSNVKKAPVMLVALSGAAITLGFFIFLIRGFFSSPSTLSLFLLMYGGSAFAGFLLYLLVSRWSKAEERQIRQDFLVIGFLTAMAGALWMLNESIYVKPAGYYIFVSFAAGMVGLQALFTRGRGVLIQILFLAFVIRTSSFFINPYLFGADSFWHFNTVFQTVEGEHLLENAGHYYYYPSFSFLGVFLQMLTITSENVYALGSIVLSMVAVVAVYVLGRDIAGERAGYLSAIFLSISTFHIFGSINYSPMVNGFSLILISVYILIRFSRFVIVEDYMRVWIAFWLGALFVFFIHPVASMSLGLLLGANFVALRILYKEQKGLTPFYSYGIGFVAYLMFVHISLFREIVEVLFVPEDSSALPAIVFKVLSVRLLGESAISYIGPTSLLCIGVYGGLKWLEENNIKKMTYLLAVAVLYLLPISSFLSGEGGVEPGRLIGFVEGLIIIPAGVGLIDLLQKIPVGTKAPFAFSALFLVAFFSTSSYITWDGNTLFKKEVEVPVGFLTQSTVAVHPFIEKMPLDKAIYNDDRTRIYIFSEDRGILSLDREASQITYRDLENEGYFIVNDLVLEMKMWALKGDKEKFFKKLEDGNKMYDNGNVQVYEK